MKDRLQVVDIQHMGACAEHLVQGKLSSLHNNSIRMPEHYVYDLLNVSNDCKIEVKSVSHKRGNNVAFRLSERQFKSKEIDYIVALVFHDKNNPFDVDAYIVPHKVVSYMASTSQHAGEKRPGYGEYKERAFTFSIDGAVTRQPYVANLGKNKWDLLTAKNRSVMTRKKNQLAKKMIEKFKLWYLIDNPHVINVKKKRGNAKSKNWYKCKHCKNQPCTRSKMKTHLERVHGLDIMNGGLQELKHYKRIKINGKFVKGRVEA